MVRVLVTGAGGAAAVSFIKAVAGANVKLHAADADPLAAGLYLVRASRRHIVPPGAAEEFVDELLDLCARRRIDVLVPTVDAELLPIARARQKFTKLGVRLVLGRTPALESCLDKWRLHQTCEGVVRQPATTIVRSLSPLANLPHPFVAKPRCGSGGRGVSVVRDETARSVVPTDGSMIAQEFLPGEEYSVDVLANLAGRVIAAVPRVRLKVDSGVAVTARTLRDLELMSAASRVVRHLGLTYVSNVQFRRDRAGRLALLEVNPRFPGSMPLTVAAGVNMPRLSLRIALGESVGDRLHAFRETAVVRYLAEEFVSPSELLEMQEITAQRARARLVGQTA